jgi:hypothetical protein
MENNELISVLKNIETRLENIENILNETKISNQKMDDHIDFIDGVYDTVRKPFSTILSICTNSSVEIKDKTNIVKEIKN